MTQCQEELGGVYFWAAWDRAITLPQGHIIVQAVRDSINVLASVLVLILINCL